MSSKGAKRLQKDILPDEPSKDRSKSGTTSEDYETKILELTDSLHRMKEKYTSLQIENENMTKAHEKFNQDKQDIVDYLHIELSNKDKAIANADEKIHQLETKIIGLHQSHSEETENLKRQHQYEIANLTSRINLLQQELTEILEFKGKKGELEEQLKDLNSLLVEKDKEYKCDIQHLERKYIQDKKFLKKDMVQKVTDAVGTFKKMADQQMEDTTKRVIRENLTISSQLRNLSTKTLELITENELLKKKNGELRINNSLLQEEQKVMAKRYKIKHLSKKQIIAASMEGPGIQNSSPFPNETRKLLIKDRRKSTQIVDNKLCTLETSTPNLQSQITAYQHTIEELAVLVAKNIYQSEKNEIAVKESENEPFDYILRMFINDLKSNRVSLHPHSTTSGSRQDHLCEKSDDTGVKSAGTEAELISVYNDNQAIDDINPVDISPSHVILPGPSNHMPMNDDRQLRGSHQQTDTLTGPLTQMPPLPDVLLSEMRKWERKVSTPD